MTKFHKFAEVLLILGCTIVGGFVGLVAACVIAYIFFLPHHGELAPGDGIILMLLSMILVPAGALAGGAGVLRLRWKRWTNRGTA